MKQFLYTDNLRGGGLSYLKQSAEFTESYLMRLEPFCGYHLGNTLEGYRYNLSFAGKERPVLLNSVYLGREVTSNRNGNFLTHGVVSDEPLKGYAVDYFANDYFFRKTLAQGEAKSDKMPESLPDIYDSGKSRNEAGFDLAVEILNKNIAFSCNLLQAVLFALKNRGNVGLFNFDSTKEYGNALNIVRAVQYLFPINFANKITFNTRATSYNPSAKINLSVFEGERATGCTFGSVEVLQFYDESRSVCDTKGCDYYFFYNQNTPVKTLLPSIKWLFDGGITTEKIVYFQNRISELSDPLGVLLSSEWDKYLISGQEPEIKAQQPDKYDYGKTKVVNKKKFLAVFITLIAVLLIAVTLVVVFVKNNDAPVDDPPPGPPIVVPDPNAYFEIKFEDGTEKRFRFNETVQLDIPAAITGYTFEGYVDAEGKLLTDSDGKLLEDYEIKEYAKITVSESWKANSNSIIISYGEGKNSELSCLTDGEITIPQALVNSIAASYPHSNVKGFMLGGETGDVICLIENGELKWKDGYRTLSAENYRSQLENGEPIRLYPDIEYSKYTVDFYDYYTSAKLGSAEISYDKEITVSPSYTEKYMLKTYYVYARQGDELVKVFNTPESPDKWTGEYGFVKGYDAVIDRGENISLYISGLARVRMGNEQLDIEYGDDVFELSEQKLADSALKKVNTMYLGQSREIQVNSNTEFWVNADATSVITATPAYSAVFRFGYNTGMSLLDYGGVTFERTVTYLHFSDGGYSYGGDDMADINAALELANPYISFGNGTTSYADLINDEWTTKSGDVYSEFENYFLKTATGGNSLFNGNGEFCGDESVFEEEQNGYITVYAVYKPKKVTLKFAESVNDYAVEAYYGGAVNWGEINDNVKGVYKWGTYASDWTCGRLLLSGKTGEEDVTASLLSTFGASANNDELVINFAIKRANYSISINLSYGSYKYYNTKLYYNSNFTWEVDKIEGLYDSVTFDTTAWNEGWYAGDKLLDITSRTHKMEDVFKDTGELRNNVLTINAEKAVPDKRSYVIKYSEDIYHSVTQLIRDKKLKDTFADTSDKVITYDGDVSLGIPKDFTLEESIWEYKYSFDGWYCGNTKITGKDGMVVDFDKLLLLSEGNKTLTVRAVYNRDRSK